MFWITGADTFPLRVCAVNQKVDGVLERPVRSMQRKATSNGYEGIYRQSHAHLRKVLARGPIHHADDANDDRFQRAVHNRAADDEANIDDVVA
jgi:hypothetical protein